MCQFSENDRKLVKSNIIVLEVVMAFLKKVVKCILPYFMVRIYQKFHSRMVEKKLPEIENFEQRNGSYIFSPWLSDNEFNNIYNQVENYTLLGKLKSYVLWELVKETNSLKGAIIEVGVWRGGSGLLIGKQAGHSINSSTLYLCDTFTGVVKTGEKDTFYKGGEHANTSIEIVEELFKKFEVKNIKILKGIFPEETCNFINDAVFKFCHIDVDAYQSTKDIFEWIWPKMVTGGIILIDDYGYYRCDGVIKFVNEEKFKPDRIVINNWVGQAIIIKRQKTENRHITGL
jgi:O-methyltransferase